jgi:60 kDa SS-A/Ro ribonucleoprotein
LKTFFYLQKTFYICDIKLLIKPVPIKMTKFRNQNLRSSLANMQPKAELVEAIEIPKPDTKNRQGHAAYSLDKWLRLLSMLNTLKLESQFYRSENETMKELKELVDTCAKEDAYMVAQSIVYSRCVGEGMRSINHLAASYLAPHCAGKEWAKRFYGLWNKKTKSGGTIFRPDDMAEIVACFSAMNKVKVTNSMKKGFATALETMDTYSLLKYKSSLIDVINLVHPRSEKSGAVVEVNKEKVSVIDAIMKGLSVSADTWEVAQSDAGQEVAKAVKEGKIDASEAEKVLKEAKAENWNALLTEGKLGIMAALRNIRNIIKTDANSKTIDLLCALLSDAEAIRKGKIMPYQIDLAHEVTISEFSSAESRKVAQALLKGYASAVPNLAEMLPGRTLVMVDFSGSMTSKILDPNRKTNYTSSCLDKAALIAATIAKGTNADVIRFGSTAEYVKWSPNSDVFSIASSMKKDMGGTSLSSAWSEAQKSGKKYDRVFILSDNECNHGSSYNAYTSYVKALGGPYVYSVDLAAYGTTQLVGDKVRYYYGYGYTMFDDIAKSEFNPNYHLDKVKQIVI